jgi:hypothetical protein
MDLARSFTGPRCAGGGLFLAALSFSWLLYGFGAARAQIAYFRARYGGENLPAEAIVERCGAAQRAYPRNYHFCRWAALRAWESAAEGGPRAEKRRAAAERWCGAGLALNPYDRLLRLVKTRLLEGASVAEALRFWEKHVAWQFWEPRNHAVLVDLYARAGDYDRAMRSLRLIRGTPSYPSALQALRRAWAKEMEPNGQRGR